MWSKTQGLWDACLYNSGRTVLGILMKAKCDRRHHKILRRTTIFVQAHYVDYNVNFVFFFKSVVTLEDLLSRFVLRLLWATERLTRGLKATAQWRSKKEPHTKNWSFSLHVMCSITKRADVCFKQNLNTNTHPTFCLLYTSRCV